MRRTLLLTAMAIAGLLATASSASALRPGFSLPTERLEGAYKFALQARRFAPDGCYPPPNAMAKLLRQKTNHKVGIARNTSHLGHLNQVYVLRQGTNCDQLRMALRARGSIYVLDTRQGTVRLQGRRGAATPGLARTLTGVVLATRTFRLSKPDTAPRLETLCPGHRSPVGGGITVSPPTGPDGEGIYPHSFERLGAQLGFHVSVVVFDPDPTSTTPRSATVQAVCGYGVIPATPTPHKTVYVRPGQSKTVTARCPRGQFLVSGGFQRTDWRSDGGDYITESRASGKRAWTVSGHAYGSGSGELTAIAYCARMPRPILSEVSSLPVPVTSHGSATATSASCPSGKRLTAGGFSTGGSSDGFFAGGSINPNDTFSASEYGFFGPLSSLTAYGYCLPARG